MLHIHHAGDGESSHTCGCGHGSCGCGGHEHESHTTAQVVDPVCGMSVDPASAAAVRDFEGTTYAFCSRGCAKDFDKDPEQYLAAAH